jgi:hypothetical protein
MAPLEILVIFMSSISLIIVPIAWVNSRKSHKRDLARINDMKENANSRNRFAENFTKDL